MSQSDLRCPSCGGELESENKSRSCDTCRSRDGKILELWIAFQCFDKYKEPIPPRLLKGKAWSKLNRAAHKLARREDRHDEYKADNQTDKLEYLFEWAFDEHGISRNDCFGMPVEKMLRLVQSSLDSSSAGVEPSQSHQPATPIPENSATSSDAPKTADPADNQDREQLMEVLSIWSARQKPARLIVECLWKHTRLVGWDGLPQKAFRGDDRPTNEAVHKALKRIKEALSKNFDRFKIDLEILESERRVRLVKPPDSSDS